MRFSGAAAAIRPPVAFPIPRDYYFLNAFHFGGLSHSISF
jgi:hypothetical protein